MRDSYFSNFPTIEYDIKDDGNKKVVTNILKRVVFRSGIDESVAAFYKETLVSASRPEVVAFEKYTDPNLNWMLMLLNKVEDPYYDWYIDSRVLDEIIEKKYPSSNKVITLPSTHYSTDLSDKKLFHVGEELKDSVTGLSAGDIVDFDADTRQIVLTTVPEWNAGSSIIVGQQSEAKFNWTTDIANTEVSHRFAVHHYEKPDNDDSTIGSGIVVGSTYTGAIAITNAQNLINENEKKRDVSILNGQYISIARENFIEEIKK